MTMTGTHLQAISTAAAAFDAAEHAWSLELKNAFGKDAGDVRYTPAGKGAPGTTLRFAHDLREAARVANEAARSLRAALA